MKKTSLLVLALALSATAQASVWDRAVTTPEDEVAKDLYDAKMLEGDTATLSSTIQSASLKTTLAAIKRAEAAYRAASSIRPREGEPYFRIGNLIYELHFDCDNLLTRSVTCNPDLQTADRMQLAVDAWNEFEKRAPLDPRVAEILIKRAILNTKLVNGGGNDKVHLLAAAHDYQAALDRSDGLSGAGGDEQTLGNLAETYMMLNRLDDSIARYQQAVSVGAARVSTMYGLAVALDRDGSGDQAMRKIQAQGVPGFEAFDKEFRRGQVFFVPAGESNYYYALAHEAFGNYGAALEYWTRYLQSGAHPEFQPRAREHVEAMRKKHVRATPPPDEPDEP